VKRIRRERRGTGGEGQRKERSRGGWQWGSGWEKAMGSGWET